MSNDSTNSHQPIPNMIQKGRFYFLYEDSQYLILEDKTKRGLEVKEKIANSENSIISERGMIYDMDGIGHKVAIRWFYPKSRYNIDFVMNDAKSMEKRYNEIREMTCPDDF